jgi:hypothetical protein
MCRSKLIASVDRSLRPNEDGRVNPRSSLPLLHCHSFQVLLLIDYCVKSSLEDRPRRNSNNHVVLALPKSQLNFVHLHAAVGRHERCRGIENRADGLFHVLESQLKMLPLEEGSDGR